MADEEEIRDVDADPRAADWIKVVYADVGVTLEDVKGLPGAAGVKRRNDAEGPQPFDSVLQAVAELDNPPLDPAE